MFSFNSFPIRGFILQILFFIPITWLFMLFTSIGVRLWIWNVATNRPIVHLPGDMSLNSHGGIILAEENRRTQRKTCLSAIINPTWTNTGANPGLCGMSLVTNDLSHGTATTQLLLNFGIYSW
jgi:hypothetical protein